MRPREYYIEHQPIIEAYGREYYNLVEASVEAHFKSRTAEKIDEQLDICDMYEEPFCVAAVECSKDRVFVFDVVGRNPLQLRYVDTYK